MAAPLEGVRVLDLGTRIAAPFCAGVMGEMGAEVRPTTVTTTRCSGRLKVAGARA